MLGMSSKDITDPHTYSTRDLLLLVQLVHHLVPLTEEVNSQNMLPVLAQWKTHPASKLSPILSTRELTADNVVVLYTNVAQGTSHPSDKVAICMCLYQRRMEEVNDTLKRLRSEFSDELSAFEHMQTK